MAYLSDSDENEQQQQSQGQTQGNQGFNIYLPASSAQGGASQSGAPPQGAAAQIAQKSAAEYSQPIGASAAPGMETPNSAKPIEPQDNPMAPGMGQASTAAGNVPGAQQNGYINFSNYLNSNPTMAGQVSDYGNKALAAGNTAFNKAQSDYEAHSGQSQFSDPWSGDQPTENSIATQISTGDLTPEQVSAIQGYGVENYNGAAGSDYAPSGAFNSALGSFGISSGAGPTNYGANQAGTLAQQLYAQQKPSLQQEVTPGTTALDTALLQADPNVQKAVGAQQAALGSLNTKANQQTLADTLQSQDYQQEAKDIQNAQQGALAQVQDRLAQEVVDAKANGQTAEGLENPNSAMYKDLQSYEDWLKHPNGGMGTFTVNAPGAAGYDAGPGADILAKNISAITGNAVTAGDQGIDPNVTYNANQARPFVQQPDGTFKQAPPMTAAQYAASLGYTPAQIEAMGLS